MTPSPNLPEAKETVKVHHHILSAPLRLMSALNIGPFGGENSISAVIEAVIAKNMGETVTYSLSKTDQSFVNMLTGKDIPDEMIEYRELNHAAQREILERWGAQKLGVIWIGAGVFTLLHPLIAERKPEDWHVWTDALPKVVADAEEVYQEMKARGDAVNLFYNIMLPKDVDRLNRTIDLVAPDVDHLVIFGYGVTYALTMQENYEWLSQLHLPDKGVSFVFNSPGASLPVLPGVMASFHRQRMVYYERSHIEALFKGTIPTSEIVWELPREETRNKLWGTWLIHAPADKRG